MSGHWEKYVERGTDALRAAGFVDSDDDTVPTWPDDNPIPVWVRAEYATRALLAVVGPLIAEDTRERMVAAAARAVERKHCASPRSNHGDGRGCEDDHCPRHGRSEEVAP